MYEARPVITNSILYDNIAPPGQGDEICLGYVVHPDDPATLDIRHSNVKGGPSSVYITEGSSMDWGDHMLDLDPRFADPVGNDFHLLYASPCRDAGDDAAVITPEDFEGDSRARYGPVDIGADEFHPHLYTRGEALPGSVVTAALIGFPGSAPVGLFFGAGLLDPPIPSAWGLFYLQAPWILVPLEPISASGLLELPLRVPNEPSAISELPMQGLIGLEPDSLTNLHLLPVRVD